jgi:hypothetical protein
MEQRYGPLAVELIQGRHCDYSTYLAKRAKAQLAHAQRCSLLIIEQCCGLLGVEMVPGNTAISTHILPRDRELSLAHAQMCSFLII